MDTETEGLEQGPQPSELSNTTQLIAAAVRAQAAWRGWDQRDIARETGLKPAYISLRWRAERAWSLDDIERISRALNMDVWKFFEAARVQSTISVAVRPRDSQASTSDDSPGEPGRRHEQEPETDVPRSRRLS